MCFIPKRTLITGSRLISCLLLFILLTGCIKSRPILTVLTTATPSKVPQAVTDSAKSPNEGDTIAKIQGAGHISPYRGQSVVDVHGIVTVLCSDGFYLQSIQPDGDPATSEGIFVFTEWVPDLSVGDEILVSGWVDEITSFGGSGDLSRTQINDPEYLVLSTENALPAPTIIGEGGRLPPREIIDDDTDGFISKNVHFDPESDGLDFYESLEGMLVQVNDAVVVGPTNAFKEIVVLGDLGARASLRTDRGGILLRVNDPNPERIIMDDLLVALPFLDVGDYATRPILGVMDYDYGNFKFLVIEEPSFQRVGLSRSDSLTPTEEGYLRVATYNVANLSAVQTQRIASLANQIVNRMASPDIIALQEIQDDDGSEGQVAVSAGQTYQGIIKAIIDLGGPPYGYVDIDPIPDADGGVPFGNIRVGFLYRLDRGLTLADAPRGDAKTPVQVKQAGDGLKLSLNPGRISPNHPAFYASRKPLVVSFLYQGETIFLVNNHFISKGEDRPLFGEFQPPILESEGQRMGQAQLVHDFVAEILAIDPECMVMVLGDLNDFQFSLPLIVLEEGILTNLIRTLPEPERYDYIYEGNSQALDHILVSDKLMRSFVSLDILHVNAEFDYLQRFSDHDPLIATFKVE